MNDTHPNIQKKLDSMYSKMTGQERVLIGFSMLDAAKKIILSSLPKDLTPVEKKFNYF